MKEAILFGASWCPACLQAKKYLTDRMHTFRYVTVETTEGMAELQSLVTSKSIPVFVVKDGESIKSVIGFAPSKFEEMLK